MLKKFGELDTNMIMKEGCLFLWLVVHNGVQLRNTKKMVLLNTRTGGKGILKLKIWNRHPQLHLRYHKMKMCEKLTQLKE